MNSFFTHMKLDESSGCWNWTGSKNNSGYGKRLFRGKHDTVHRISAILYLGFKPSPGLRVLHNCDNPACFNPKHLYIGTDKDNVADRYNRGRDWQSKVTHCPKGHAYEGENLIITKVGGRKCRACAVAYRKDYAPTYYKKYYQENKEKYAKPRT